MRRVEVRFMHEVSMSRHDARVPDNISRPLPNFACNSLSTVLTFEIGSLESCGFLSSPMTEAGGIACEISGRRLQWKWDGTKRTR